MVGLLAGWAKTILLLYPSKVNYLEEKFYLISIVSGKLFYNITKMSYVSVGLGRLLSFFTIGKATIKFDYKFNLIFIIFLCSFLMVLFVYTWFVVASGLKCY